MVSIGMKNKKRKWWFQLVWTDYDMFRMGSCY